MNEKTISEWKQWYEDLERRKLKNGSIRLTMLRPDGKKIQPLTDTADGVHPLLTDYEKKIDYDNYR